jgi:cytoskeletal protein CcmA (bactofilin family)
MTDTSQPSAHVQGSTAGASTIGEELMITGNVTSTGDVHLDGQVQGDIHCISLFLGGNSRLEGSVIAENVVISGRLVGSVRALRVTLQSKSHVEGDLFHQSLAIEQGAHFEGKSCPSEDPLSRQSAPEDRAATKPQRPNAPKQHSHKPLTAATQSLPEAR